MTELIIHNYLWFTMSTNKLKWYVHMIKKNFDLYQFRKPISSWHYDHNLKSLVYLSRHSQQCVQNNIAILLENLSTTSN